MHELSLKVIMETKFSSHRGVPSLGVESDSLGAISAAFALKPPFIELDVVAARDGVIRMGHPPQKPMEPLEDVLDLFHECETYPKIDIKSSKYSDTLTTVDDVLEIVFSKKLPLVLITIGRGKNEIAQYLSTQRHLAESVLGHPAVRLSFDIRTVDEIQGETATKEHMRALGDTVASVAAEIHEQDFDTVGLFAQTYEISKIEFWLSGPPEVANPSVTEETIREALRVEERYDVIVYLDMDRGYVLPNPAGTTR